MAVLVTVVLALLLTILAVLSIPWVVSIVGATEPAGLRVEVRPFSIGCPLRIRFEPGQGDTRQIGEPEPGENTPRKRIKRRGKARRSKEFPVKPALRALPDLFAGFRSIFRVEVLRLSGRLGLSDPADTGQLFGVILPVKAMLHRSRFSVDVVPDFTGPTFEGTAEARLRIVLIRGLFPAMRFCWRVFVRPS